MKKNKNFIRQIALERMYRLMDLAIENWEKHSERSLDYLKLMKKIGMKNKVKIPKELKKLYCKKCFSLLLTGKDKETRIKDKKLSLKCKNCGKIKEIVPEKKKENFVLGVTGTIGSGKTTVLKELEKKGFIIFEADKIAKKEMEKIKEKIQEKFGNNIATKKGIDYWKLANLVFNNKKKLEELNELVHPLVRKKLEEELKGRKFTAMEIPLLFESGMENLCDKILVVYSKKENLIERKTKQGMKKEDVLKRISVQMNLKDKKKKADLLMENDGSLKELKIKVDELMEELN